MHLALTWSVLMAEDSVWRITPPDVGRTAGQITSTPGAASGEGPGRSSGLEVPPQSPSVRTPSPLQGRAKGCCLFSKGSPSLPSVTHAPSLVLHGQCLSLWGPTGPEELQMSARICSYKQKAKVCFERIVALERKPGDANPP